MAAAPTTQRPTLIVGGVAVRPGDLLRIGPEASVQFRNGSGFVMRLIRVPEWTTYRGWTWLDGYQLDERGEAVARRTIFVQIAGLRVLRRSVALYGGNGSNSAKGSKVGQRR